MIHVKKKWLFPVLCLQQGEGGADSDSEEGNAQALGRTHKPCQVPTVSRHMFHSVQMPGTPVVIPRSPVVFVPAPMEKHNYKCDMHL